MELGKAAEGPTTLLDELRGLVGPGSRDLWLIYLATFLEYLGIFSFLQPIPLWLSGDFGLGELLPATVGHGLVNGLVSYVADASGFAEAIDGALIFDDR